MRLVFNSIRLFWNRVPIRPGLVLALVLLVANPGCSKKLSPASFDVSAKFSIDEDLRSLSTAIATVEERPGVPGYSWLRIYFYSFPPTEDDIVAAMQGDVRPMDKRWHLKSSNVDDYNHSWAALQFGIDSGFKVWQVDMSVPGYTCTIAPFEQDVKAFLQTYHFDGKNLKLTSNGSYLCDMKATGGVNHKFGWDISIDIPVFKKAPGKLGA